MIESNVTVRGMMVPTPHGAQLTRSVEAIGLHRDEHHVVTGSERLADSPATDDAVRLLRGVGQLATTAGLPVQSAVSTTVERAGPLGTSRWSTVLARIESVAGPVLAGAGTAGEPTALLESAPMVAAKDIPRTPVVPVPRGVADRVIVLHPPVAAIVVAGAAMALTSAGGRRFRERNAGRTVLPGLSLTDVPLMPGESALDDLGGKAEPVDLVRDGRAVSPEEPRRLWDHDSRSLVPATGGLRLTGPDSPYPDAALELHWCVEGLQRYHPDGTVALHCLARAGDWFAVTLRGRPLHLLRAVIGRVGPAWTVSTDSDVTTPALVLPTARELLSKDHDGRAIILSQS